MAVPQSSTTAATVGRRIRRLRTKQERRQIVEESLKPVASVSLVARAHDVNTNQVFKWRRQYQQGRLEVESPATLLPVKIADAVLAVRATAHRKSRARRSGIIDIDLGH